MPGIQIPSLIIHTAFRMTRSLEARGSRRWAVGIRSARPVAPSTLLTIVSQRLGAGLERRTSSRKQVSERIEVNIADTPASLVDLSYDGFQVELHGGEIPSPFKMHLPALGFSVSGKVVWARRPPTQPGALRCGVEVSDLDEKTETGLAAGCRCRLAS